ncbi:hypothetical protein BJX63DRAFT_273774 [Aspergillus granulosus]|uniref:Uncharacterized protein n=1 Tax=Aspergillus granulosus TaxID=176169 RepID=A0ABR4H7Z8_9EURO
MWWMLIAADGLFANTSGGDRQMSLMRRKHRAYLYLNTELAATGGRVTDEILGGIIMAAITEARLSDPTACSAHLQGFEGAVRARGGLKASLVACTIPALRLAHLMPYLVCDPLQDSESDGQRQLQQFVQFLMIQMRRRSFSTFPVGASPQTGLLQFKNIIGAHGSALLYTSLARYLQVEDRRIIRFADEAASFLSFFLITLTLWRMSESIQKPQLFITRLSAVLEGSCAFGEDGRPMLTLQGLMWVVIKAIQDLQAQTNEVREDYELWAILNGIEALRVYRSMSCYKARRRARILLLHILVGEDF